jgi:guanosine-3',5'-bis(diphosphate) 3'-pyrophosphohydrolase
MPASVADTYRNMLEAVSFAARAHQHQVRKDQRTPYASHPFRVCLILRQVFGIDDPRILTAAILHDTLEDTQTDFDDLEEKFGREVAAWASALSKDKRQPEKDREEAYVAQLMAAPWQVKVCKLADLFDNMMDAQQLGSTQTKKAFQKFGRYLEAMGDHPPSEIRSAYEVVKQLLTELTSGGR